VSELGAQAKTPLEVSIELRPTWGGVLGIDGKAIFVRGSRHCLLIGVDHPTQDIVHALVLEAETADGLARLETEARLDAGHPLSGVVADLGPGFAQAHRDYFGATSFQARRVHFDRRLDSDIPKARWSAKAPLYAELKARVRAVLYAPNYDEAEAKSVLYVEGEIAVYPRGSFISRFGAWIEGHLILVCDHRSELVEVVLSELPEPHSFGLDDRCHRC